MSNEQPKPVPRKPRVRTSSQPNSQHLLYGGLEQGLGQMNIGQGDEIQRLNDQVAALKQEEQRLRKVIAQLEQQLSTHQGTGLQRGPGASEAALKQREAELQQRENELHRQQKRFHDEVSDREFTLKNRELELRRMEDELTARKKEMALARFDDETDDDVSSAQLARLADRKIELQKEEDRLKRKEYDLTQWAMKLDQQSQANQQRLIEIQQREAGIGSYPVPSHTHTQVQPHPQWGGHTSPVTPATTYQHHSHGPQAQGGGYAAPGQQWPSQGSPSPSAATGYQPYTTSQAAAGHSPSSPGYNQPLPQHPTQHPAHHNQPLPQHHTHPYPSPHAYQQPPSPHSSPEGQGGYHAGGHVPAHGGQSASDGGIGRSYSTSGERPLSGTYLNPPLVEADRSKSAEQVTFSVGGGASSSTSVASAAATSHNYPSGQTVPGGVAVGGATGRSRMQAGDHSEEVARALQWEEQNTARQLEDADMEYARKLQEEYDAEVRRTQQHGHTSEIDQLLALQLQHEDLKQEYGPGLTEVNQLNEGEGAEVTEVVKKVLDERMTRQFQIKEQEEQDRRLAEGMSSNGPTDASLQTNLQNNLSS